MSFFTEYSHTWWPFLYLYGLGGLLFLAGIIITIKSGSFNLKRPSHQKWFWVLIFGFIWYLALHGTMTLAALGHEKTAGWIAGFVILGSIIGAVWVNSRIKGRI
ncbi:MAG: hypothetical protein IIB44_00020 [Candidatus Marinimicrobia bacterium]|nr:hypothetical protein [Candidatus Neomarinimicrobiota bacterium]MCH8069085.1 hypothetical protein [Candidatus Neomarinimicrobiota bacterium]